MKLDNSEDDGSVLQHEKYRDFNAAVLRATCQFQCHHLHLVSDS